MHKVALIEAEKCLSELVQEAAEGQEVIITQDDGSAFRIVPVVPPKPHPKFGSAKGQVRMSGDFDEPLKDFEEYGP